MTVRRDEALAIDWVSMPNNVINEWTSGQQFPLPLETVQDFLIKLDIKPLHAVSDYKKRSYKKLVFEENGHIFYL